MSVFRVCRFGRDTGRCGSRGDSRRIRVQQRRGCERRGGLRVRPLRECGWRSGRMVGHLRLGGGDAARCVVAIWLGRHWRPVVGSNRSTGWLWPRASRSACIQRSVNVEEGLGNSRLARLRRELTWRGEGGSAWFTHGDDDDFR